MNSSARRFTWIETVALLLWAIAPAIAFAEASANSIAFFYGANPPWDELRAFDIAVVDPRHAPDPKVAPVEVAPFAYVAVGEVTSERPYFNDIPADWRLGKNPAWNSIVLDQAQPAWPDFFAERIIRPLWEAGYRGFFLDALDSYQLYAKDEAARRAQEAGLARVIRELRQRFPDIRLMLNRGFEILPEIHRDVFAVAAESLYQGWDQAGRTYRPVAETDRAWLLRQLDRIRQEYRLPVVAIDYVAPHDRALARETAKQIAAHGFVPWVSTPELDMLGVGNIEVMPRKVMVIHNDARDEFGLTFELAQRYAAMPLNYLGYTLEFVDARKPLPEHSLAGRYAGILIWLARPPGPEGRALAQWIEKQATAGLQIALLDQLNFLLDSPVGARLGLRVGSASPLSGKISVAAQDPLFGFEVAPQPDRDAFRSLQAEGGTPLLRLRDEQSATQDAAALMPWGGYILSPYVLTELPQDVGIRWVVQPIEFLRRALKLPAMPVPDATTESGRRMLLAHMDGDGFANRAEMPGKPLAAEVVRDRILKKYRIPTAVSVIQGEISPNGLNRPLSPKLESVARDLFALPHVEIASHSLSHPFNWRKVESGGATEDGEDYRLALPDYRFDLRAEIAGSVDYIRSRLAPPGKPVKLFLWTGDCNPGADALMLAEQAGVLAMNGGETLITRSAPSLTGVAPLGVPKNGHFQVYAPNQNENVYTNRWTGPFYGYRRVIETFELTDVPYRLKPINIYFHTFAATRPAGLDALDRVYRWALAQETTPVYPSEYIRKALDFNRLVVARTPDGWLVRGAENLRELRAPAALGRPDIGSSKNLAGFTRRGEDTYLHLAGSEAKLRFGAAPAAAPYLVSANARVERASRPSRGELHLALRGHVPLKFTLGNIAGCGVHTGGKTLKPSATRGTDALFFLTSHALEDIRIHCAQ